MATAKKPTSRKPSWRAAMRRTPSKSSPSAKPAARATALESLARAAGAKTAAAQRGIERVLTQIAAKKRLIGETFYEMGVLLKQLRDEQAHAVFGHDTFREFLEKRKVLGPTQAF